MRIVVTGGSGMLGHRLIRLACPDHAVWGSFQSHAVDLEGCQMFPLDLADGNQCRTQLKAIEPDVVIHTAALTDVDRCDREPDLARQINTDGAGVLAGISEEIGARFVYVSTDYVFDGEKGNYSEDDVPSPVNYYGESKLLGENLVRQRCSKSLILRTMIYGLKLLPQRGMIESLLDALRRGGTVSRFADQFATPLYTGHFSQIIMRLLDMDTLGLFHVASADRISRFEFTQELARIFAVGPVTVQPVPFKHIAGLARRPRDSSLDCRRVEKLFGEEMPTVRAGLELINSEWKTSESGAGR